MKKKVQDITTQILISIRDEIIGLRGEIVQLREDTNARFRELEQDMSAMKQDMASVKQDIKAIAAHIKKTGIGPRDSGLVWYNEENGTRDPGLGVRRCEKALNLAS